MIIFKLSELEPGVPFQFVKGGGTFVITEKTEEEIVVASTINYRAVIHLRENLDRLLLNYDFFPDKIVCRR